MVRRRRERRPAEAAYPVQPPRRHGLVELLPLRCDPARPCAAGLAAKPPVGRPHRGQARLARPTLLQAMRPLQAAPRAPLSPVQDMCAQGESPLPMDRKLCRLLQPRPFPPLPHLGQHRHLVPPPHDDLQGVRVRQEPVPRARSLRAPLPHLQLCGVRPGVAVRQPVCHLPPVPRRQQHDDDRALGEGQGRHARAPRQACRDQVSLQHWFLGKHPVRPWRQPRSLALAPEHARLGHVVPREPGCWR
ncbi:hypothetical protein VHUM_01005 [Vanrija humicola]|uniref:Uncharacterized protein n=1 Tax=Vanrija humicola TaxID=5417 RepID=A0A7D8V513_VANHU|nr:hypothetical protein VHUM_01005 [Vanrija humicola]